MPARRSNPGGSVHASCSCLRDGCGLDVHGQLPSRWRTLGSALGSPARQESRGINSGVGRVFSETALKWRASSVTMAEARRRIVTAMMMVSTSPGFSLGVSRRASLGVMFKPVRIVGVLAAVALLRWTGCDPRVCTLMYPRCAIDVTAARRASRLLSVCGPTRRPSSLHRVRSCRTRGTDLARESPRHANIRPARPPPPRRSDGSGRTPTE